MNNDICIICIIIMIFCRLYQLWNHSAFSPALVSLVCFPCPSPSFWLASHLTYRELSRAEMPASVVISTSQITNPTNAVRGTTSTYSYANTTPNSYWNYLLRWIFIWLRSSILIKHVKTVTLCKQGWSSFVNTSWRASTCL